MAIDALLISKAPNMRFHWRNGDDEQRSPKALTIPAPIYIAILAVSGAISAELHST